MAHFLTRMVSGGQDASSEFELGWGGMLGLLAAPGAFTCFLMLDKYSAFLNWMRGHLRDDLYVTSVPDKYLFITLAMAVTGLVVVLKWDRLLPDSQDYLNLAPLPVGASTILLANAAAILFATVVVALDVNALPVAVFPMFVTAAGRSTFTAFLQFSGVHLLVVLLASLFAISALFAILGTLSAILPRNLFRACSAWIRSTLVLGLLTLLLSGFTGATLMRHLQSSPDSMLRFLPPLWFLGLYQRLQGRATPQLDRLAATGMAALATAVLLMVAAYAFSYRRRFAGVMEGGRRPAEHRIMAVFLALLDRFAMRASGFERACHQFAVRALLRNETHRLVLAVAIGLGYLVAFRTAAGNVAAGVFQGPLMVAYLTVLGIRVAFELPAGVPANWIFRSIVDPRTTESLALARRVVFSFLVPLVLAPTAVAGWWYGGVFTSLIETAYVFALSGSLIELQFAGYRKIPLACPLPGFRDNLLMLCLVQFLGFEVFSRAGAAFEQWAFALPLRFVAVPLAMYGAWHWNRRRLRDAREAGELEEGLTFENAPIRAVERLNLSDSI